MTLDRFLALLDHHKHAKILFDPSHMLLPQMDYLGFIDLYRDVAELAAARRLGRPPDPLALSTPGATEGLAWVRFVEAALALNAQDDAWMKMTAAA